MTEISEYVLEIDLLVKDQSERNLEIPIFHNTWIGWNGIKTISCYHTFQDIKNHNAVRARAIHNYKRARITATNHIFTTAWPTNKL